jgi:hypothetical protein
VQQMHAVLTNQDTVGERGVPIRRARAAGFA